MPLHWDPVGPEPASVYWRRRVLLLLAVLVALVLLALPFRGGGEDTLTSAEPTARPSATPTPTPSASASPSASVEAVPCPDAALEVKASTDTADYQAGGRAVLTVVVKNVGTTPCTRAVGQGAVELTVTSGEDRIWSSDDCAPGGPPGEVVLQPGDQRTARATWSLTRSAPGCPPDQPQAQPGTYRLNARVGELRVTGSVFRVNA